LFWPGFPPSSAIFENERDDDLLEGRAFCLCRPGNENSLRLQLHTVAHLDFRNTAGAVPGIENPIHLLLQHLSRGGLESRRGCLARSRLLKVKAQHVKEGFVAGQGPEHVEDQRASGARKLAFSPPVA
jgi:hypothetical protein